jgi:hypothetical protein
MVVMDELRLISWWGSNDGVMGCVVVRGGASRRKEKETLSERRWVE